MRPMPRPPNPDGATELVSLKIPRALLAAVESAAAAAGETRHGWLLGAVRARLAAWGDVVAELLAARAEAAERLAELDAALRKVCPHANYAFARCTDCGVELDMRTDPPSPRVTPPA